MIRSKKLFLIKILSIFIVFAFILDSNLVSAKAEEPASVAERALAAQKEIRTSSVGKYGMTPIAADKVKDGVYPVEVESSSPFFRIIAAELTVCGGVMTAEITISSTSYLNVYPGTAEQAESDAPENYICSEETDGHSVFTIPVEALNSPVPCAAFSKKRSRWYDRLLVFDAASLPEGTVDAALLDYELIEEAILAYDTSTAASEAAAKPHKVPEAVSVPRSDGEYSIELNMTGGSGRASISSPTLMIVRGGKAYARLIWSSTYYDYMIVEDEMYYNLADEGSNSVFEIPITVMDYAMPVVADTTAMGDPLEIHYTLTFYAETIGSKGQIPQEAAKKVLFIAAAIIIIGAVPNYFLKKKRK
jgi:hypothetical protein